MVHTGQEQHAKDGDSIGEFPLFFTMPTVIASMSRKVREETARVRTCVCQIWWHGMACFGAWPKVEEINCES